MRKARCVADFETCSRAFLYLHTHTQRLLGTSVMYNTTRHSDEGDYF